MVPPQPDSRSAGFGAFRLVLRRPGAALFSITGLYARLPISMIGLSIVLLVTDRFGSFALAGSLSACFALAAALIAPYGARFIDRFGQRLLLPVLAGGQAALLVLLVVGIAQAWPLPALFAIALAAGGIGPNIGSLVRARWIATLGPDPLLRTAFAWESVLDEVVFIVGPPLATYLALSASPAAGLLVCAALLLSGSLALAAQRRTEPEPVRRPAGTRSRHALLLPGMPLITLLMVLLGAVFGSFEVTTVAFAEAVGAAQATGWLLASYAAGSMVGGIALGAVSIARPLTSQLRLATLVMGVVSAPLVLAPSAAALAVLAAAAGLAVAPVLILSTALVEVVVPRARITEALTVTSSGLAVGVSVAAPASGLLIDTVAASAGYLVMAGAAIGSALLMVAAAPRLARLRPAP